MNSLFIYKLSVFFYMFSGASGAGGMNREEAPGKSPEEMYIQQKVRVLLMLKKMGSNLTPNEEAFLRNYAGVVHSQMSQLPQHPIDQGAEDVVMAFSRSETEDRRQWPLARPSHYSSTQHNTVDWWRGRSLRQERGGALLHASCSTSLLFPIPLFILTLTVTLSGPAAALPGDVQQTNQKEAWRVIIWIRCFKFQIFLVHLVAFYICSQWET